MSRVFFKRGYAFNKYDPEYYSRWGLNEHEFVLLIGRLKLWFVLHPGEENNFYCEHCRFYSDVYSDCDCVVEDRQITCTHGKCGKEKKRRVLHCLTWLREGNYVK